MASRMAGKNAIAPHMPDVAATPVVMHEGQGTDKYAQMLYLGRAAITKASEEFVGQVRQTVLEPGEIVESQRSAHQVGFGYFMYRPRGIRQPLSQPVALKPFARAENALNEVKGYQMLADLGIETFEPVGIFPAANGEGFISVTKRREDLISLDRDRWIVGRRITDEASQEIAARNTETVQEVSKLLAKIHLNGVYHDDCQLKNFVKTPTGQIGMIDAEGVASMPLNDPAAGSRAWENVDKLVRSLVVYSGENTSDDSIFGVGVLQGMSLQDTRSGIEELVIEPYLNTLSEALDAADDSQAAHVQALFDSVDGQFYGDRNWPSYRV